MSFQLFAQPWWVNLLFLFPFGMYVLWRKQGLSISKSVLITAGIFGIAFGFVEAAVVVYLRGAVGLLSGTIDYAQTQLLAELPQQFLIIEVVREFATMIMLASIAYLAVKPFRERFAIFLWAFAFWDIFYYIGLWAAIRWPSSLLTPDVLFLIPVPWYSQVWFPILVSTLTIGAVVSSVLKYFHAGN